MYSVDFRDATWCRIGDTCSAPSNTRKESQPLRRIRLLMASGRQATARLAGASKDSGSLDAVKTDRNHGTEPFSRFTHADGERAAARWSPRTVRSGPARS